MPSAQLTSHMYVICLALGDLVRSHSPHEEAGNEDKKESYRGDLGYGFKSYNENLGYIGYGLLLLISISKRSVVNTYYICKTNT